MKMCKNALACLIPVLVTAATGTAHCAEMDDVDAPDPRHVYVESISYGGSGCPQGSVSNTMSEDRATFTLMFDQFNVSVGRGVPNTEGRKNCQLSVSIRSPQGWSFAIADVEYRGYAQLSEGQTGTQRAVFYFQGETAQASATANFSGPTARDYSVRDQLPLPSLVWSTCGMARPLNINAQVRIGGDLSKQGQLTTDSLDGKVKHRLGLKWKRC